MIQYGIEWRRIESAPKDGTRFIGMARIVATYMNRFETKDRYIKRITWWGKTSHVPLYGWCYGRDCENVNLWEPTRWKSLRISTDAPKDTNLLKSKCESESNQTI
jgi:hypothetical protein